MCIYVNIVLASTKGPSWPTIIKYAVGPSLWFVTCYCASKHWRESVKMADEREREKMQSF